MPRTAPTSARPPAGLGLLDAATRRRSSAMDDEAPLYRRIEADLRARIAAGRWPRGAMIPGRHALAKELAVSLRTIERAVSALLADGSLQADDRRGTFVAAGLDQATVAVIARSEIDLTRAVDAGRWWTPRVARAMQAALAGGGVPIRFHQVGRGSLPDLAAAFAAATADGAADVVIISPSGELGWADAIARAWTPQLPPAVLIAAYECDVPGSAVYPDQRRAGYDAARHAVAAGYRAVLALRSASDRWLLERIAGSEAAVRQAEGVRWLHAAVADPAPWRGETEAAAARRERVAGMLDRVPLEPGTAVIAANDAEARAVLAELRARGRVVGREIGVIGFDDDPDSAESGLTSLAPPLEELGRVAAALIVDRRRGLAVAGSTRLAHRLVPRASTSRG